MSREELELVDSLMFLMLYSREMYKSIKREGLILYAFSLSPPLFFKVSLQYRWID